MDRNYEKELGIIQQRLSELTAKEVMYIAMLDDAIAEKNQLEEKVTALTEEIAELEKEINRK